MKNNVSNKKHHSLFTYSILIIGCIVFFLLLPVKLFAAYLTTPNDGRSSGMGNISVTTTNIWANFHNQGALSQIPHITAGFSYENRFHLNKISTKAIALAIPTRAGGLGINYSYMGYSKYNENKLGIGYGKSLAKFLSAGIQLNYMSTYIAENNTNRENISMEGGILAYPTPKFHIGAHVFNPTHAKITNKGEEHLPLIMRLGMGYQFENHTYLAIATEKEINKTAIFKVGAEHLLYEFIWLRTGIMTNPVKYSFGLGIPYKNFNLDLGFISHPKLGLSPHLSIYYSFGTNDTKQ